MSPALRAQLLLLVCVTAAAFQTKTLSSSRRHDVPFQRAPRALYDVSTPESLIEEQILQGSQQTFLAEVPEAERNKVWKRLNKAAKDKARAGSTAVGFGAAKSAPKKKTKATGEFTDYDLKADKSRYGAVIMDQGVARINERITQSTAASLLDYINQVLEKSLTPQNERQDDGEIDSQTKFADVLGKRNRWDMLMPLEDSPAVMQALHEMLVQNKVLTKTIESILGPAPQLYELGSLISDPGSERQTLHADYNYAPDFTPDVPPALTCFVALQDISTDMGPTTFVPGSATPEYHVEIQDRPYDVSPDAGMLPTSPNMLNTLDCGDCSIYNPMLLHCGCANRSERRRVIFYFSFKNPKFDETDWPLAYASLQPELRARSLTLPDIHGILKDWKKSKVAQ